MEATMSDHARVDYECVDVTNEPYPLPKEIVRRIEEVLNGEEDKNRSGYNKVDGTYRSVIRIPPHELYFKHKIGSRIISVETDIDLPEEAIKKILGKSKYILSIREY